MRNLLRQISPLLLQRSHAFEILAHTEGWSTLVERHEIDICNIVNIELESICELALQMRRMAALKTISLSDPTLIAASKENSTLDDDVAMIVRHGPAFVDRSPFIPFWSFAVLASLLDGHHHEGKNYWLSASASIVNLTRKRSSFVRRACLTLLWDAIGDTEGDLGSVVFLPFVEIVLEMNANVTSRSELLCSESRLLAGLLLNRSLPLATEGNAAQIANGAFPILANGG